MEMKAVLTSFLQASFYAFLAVALTMHGALYVACISESQLVAVLAENRMAVFGFLWIGVVAVIRYVTTRPPAVLLLDYSCFKPDHDRKCSFEVGQYFVRRSGRYSARSEEFMKGIYLKSGLGDETYCPPFIFESDDATYSSAVQELEEGVYGAVDALLRKTLIPAEDIDVVVVTCGTFTPIPSLSSLVVNRYRLREGVVTYNLGCMGCSSGLAAVDLAARVLRVRSGRHALVVATEGISLSWYFGENRSMLVTNCIFRVGCAAAMLTTDRARRGEAKFELRYALRTHRGADEASYRAAFQEEDEQGITGVSLKKDLVRVAGEGLGEHIKILGPRILPWGQLVNCLWHALLPRLRRGEEGGKAKAYVPDFTAAFEHMCVHTGGKAVIESVGRIMRLEGRVTEPARMCLHRFGNTSSSLVFYELAYFEAKGRVREGDRMWMLAFGTGFKVCSLVLRALRDSAMDDDNPWKDCIHKYPLKSW